MHEAGKVVGGRVFGYQNKTVYSGTDRSDELHEFHSIDAVAITHGAAKKEQPDSAPGNSGKTVTRARNAHEFWNPPWTTLETGPKLSLP